MVPTVLESSSHLSSQHAGAALLHREAASTRRCGSPSSPARSEYWGVQETDWADAPILAKPSATRKLKDGRTYDLYYNGSHLHMVVLRGEGGASYWVVNTLLDSLSNETMIAIAKGLEARRRGQ